MPDYVTIARVVRPQGNRGEVAADLFTDFPERFAERRRLFALAASDSTSSTRRELHLRELQLEDWWLHKGRVVLKFAGIDSITAAEALVGCELQIPLAERAPLEPGGAWVSDLIGCMVRASGKSVRQEVGVIEDLDFSAGEAPLLIVRAGKRRLEVPFATAYIERYDPASKLLDMSLPEGMLELDAPLTTEEKRAQTKGEQIAEDRKKKEKGKRKKRSKV